jgi:hypothetical protein
MNEVNEAQRHISVAHISGVVVNEVNEQTVKLCAAKRSKELAIVECFSTILEQGTNITKSNLGGSFSRAKDLLFRANQNRAEQSSNHT